MSNYQQNAVSAAIWPWCNPPVRNSAEEKAKIRKRALIQSSVGVLVGYFFALAMHKPVAAVVILVIAVWIFVSGLFIPVAFTKTEVFFAKFGRGVGAALTWILLVPFFYLCFLPGHGLLALLRKDPLKLKFPSDEPTYWEDRPPVIDVNDFKKQY